MSHITTVEELRKVYDHPKGRALSKTINMLEQHSRRLIELSPLLVLSSVGADGLGDTTPRGETPWICKIY
jgi:hypothetical protein